MGVNVFVDGQPVTLDHQIWSWDANLMPLGSIGPTWCDPVEVYRTQRNVRNVVGFLARNIAQVALHAFTSDDKGDRVRMPSQRTLPRLLAEPAPTATAFTFMRQLVFDVCLWDRYCASIEVANGRVQVRRIPPDLWQFVRSVDGAPKSIKVINPETRETTNLALTDALWLDGFPTDKETSPITALVGLLEEEVESGQYRRELWRNGARFPGYLTRPVDAPNWRTPSRPGAQSGRDRFRAGWQKFASGGVKAGHTPILEDGMEYHELQNGITPKAAEQLESRKFSIVEVATAYHLPAMFAGVLDGANYSNVEPFREILYGDVLGPWFVDIQQAFNARLLPNPLVLGTSSAFVEFNVGEKLRMSFDKQSRIFQTATGGPIMTRNEARRRLNLPQIPGADELIVPKNVSEGGQASPTDSGSQNER